MSDKVPFAHYVAGRRGLMADVFCENVFVAYMTIGQAKATVKEINVAHENAVREAVERFRERRV